LDTTGQQNAVPVVLANNLGGMQVMNGSNGHSNLVDLTSQMHNQGMSNMGVQHGQVSQQQHVQQNITSPGGQNNRSSPGMQHSRISSNVPIVPSSVGAGISPAVFANNQQQQSVHVLGNSVNFPVSNHLMIGDYAALAGQVGQQVYTNNR
jgi:hypothetical protein